MSVPNAILFRGVNDFLDRGADLTGIVDSKVGLVSAWFRIDGSDGLQFWLMSNNQGFFGLKRLTSGQMEISGFSPGVVQVLGMLTVDSFPATGKWHHLLMSWSLGTGEGFVYIDDIANIAASPTLTDDVVDLTKTPFQVGSSDDLQMFHGALSDYYFTTEFLDLSVEANRRKFIDAAGLPVFLGATGQLPTGTSALLYLQGDQTNQGLNSGTGGNLVSNGTQVPGETDGPNDPVYQPDAIFFDGTSDSMRSNGRLAGVVDGKQGAISAWIRRDDAGGVQRIIFTSINTSTSSNFVLRWEANETLRILGERPGVGPDVFNYFSSAQSLGEYIHVLCAWDVTDSAKRHLYINDVNDFNLSQQLEDFIAYDSLVNDYLLGTLFLGSVDKWPGAISDLWVSMTEYIDFSIEANRRRFITADLQPVDPGVDGSRPTGTSPTIYLRGDQTDQGINSGASTTDFASQGTQVPGETPGPGDLPPQVVPIGIATETNFAFDTFPVVGTLVDLATEIDLSQAIDKAKIKTLGLSLETDQSLPVFEFPLARFIDQVVETDLALDTVAFGGLEVFVVARLGQATGSRIIESETTSA